ncbi:2-phospho-L-lactate guanylyltransferase [Specibacter sp. RAF43]|uniref:2-phospho-L-lactate guanylyltransferase n=1 Tax=Specibacter sp. RAF43 TaxID=3233057 RepID=UPI003F98F8E7
MTATTLTVESGVGPADRDGAARVGPTKQMTAGQGKWRILLPVRGTIESKTRLLPEDRAGVHRRSLALAFARDAVAAVFESAEVAEVTVITADRHAATEFAAMGVRILHETGRDGLNAAIRRGLRYMEDAHPASPRAVLLADLPALTGADVDAALAWAALSGTAVVPDADGTGTTMITALPGHALDPAFGPGSLARHRAAGLRTLPLDQRSTIRRDVDTWSDLEQAARLGVGSHTRQTLSELGLLAGFRP